jgi:hypothetical protein
MNLTVQNSLAGGINAPFVSVTICSPTDTNCQTINNILLDTGSYGLRVFSSVLTQAGLLSSLTALTSGGRPVGECVSYADGSADWGPVVNADVVLGGQSAVNVNIQLINSSFATSSTCSSAPDSSPTASNVGFNGILGVGLFQEDCGSGCTKYSNNGIYYSCTSSSTGASCTGTTVSLANQVTNPIALLTSNYDNGVVLELPSLSGGAAPSASGYVVFGIGTVSNNTPSASVESYAASSVTTSTASAGTFDINCNGQDYASSYIDSGSNAIFFSNAASDLPTNSGSWYVPTSALTLDALVTATGGATTTYVPLTITNFDTTVSTPNYAYSTIAGNLGVSGTFDLGLPFFFGRNTYVGLEAHSSSIGNGTYWAF